MNNSWKVLAVVGLALVVAGCGGGPRLYKAGGTVTYKGAPVEGAQVTFGYDDGNFANAVTDAAGKFQLTYMGRPGGAVPGKCKVTVVKTASATTNVEVNQNPKTPEEWKAKQEALTSGMKKASEDANKLAQSGGPASLIPKKYANTMTSGLTYEIKTNEKENDFTIDLKD